MNTNFNFRYEYFVLKDSSLILKCDSLIIRMRLHPYFFTFKNKKESNQRIILDRLKRENKIWHNFYYLASN